MHQIEYGWEATGIVDLSEASKFISAHKWSKLVEEAHECEPEAQARGFSRIEGYRDGTFASPQRCRAHPGSTEILELSRSRQLLALVREKTNMPRLVPTRYGYKYYREGDYMGLHRDGVRCSITITFALTENLGTMNCLPTLRHASNRELEKLIDQAGLFPDQGEVLPVSHCAMKGFDGYNIPHWRLPFEHELGILGTICYFDL